MTIQLNEYIKTNAVFSSLNASDQAFLIKEALRKQYRNGEYITHAGDLWPYLFLVADGKVNAMKESNEGRSLVVAELEEGELFWGLGFFHEEIPNPVTYQVVDRASLYLWKRDTILPLLMASGKLTWEISRLLVKRMLHASTVIEGLAFQPVAGRLARFLMDYPGKVDGGPTLRSLTLDEMAARIGSTREMVCRFLQRFADDGLIKITRTEFEVMDGGKLLEMAQKVKP